MDTFAFIIHPINPKRDVSRKWPWLGNLLTDRVDGIQRRELAPRGDREGAAPHEERDRIDGVRVSMSSGFTPLFKRSSSLCMKSCSL